MITVVEAHVGRCLTCGALEFEAGRYGVDAALDVDRRGFTAVLVDDVKSLSVLASDVCSKAKSRAHITLGRMGKKATGPPPKPRSGRFFLR